jgi:hypothetical protein
MAAVDLEFEFLRAVCALTRYQSELEPLVASALGRPSYQYWILGHGRDDAGLSDTKLTPDGQWRFHFHGLEFDVQHVTDTRNVRVDFAPGGKLAFTPGGVGSFAMASCAPWPVFEDLKSVLRQSVGYDHARCSHFCDSLRSKGLIAYARPDLVELIRSHTRFVPGKGDVLDVSLRDLSPDETALALCDTLEITDKGHHAVR